MSKATDTVCEQFPFTVDKFPLSGPDGLSTPWYGMFRSDNSQVVGEGSVTSRYVPHQTDDVVALVEACENVFDDAVSVKTHFRNGHYVSIAPSNEYRKSIYGSKDNIFPRLIIRGGYDRRAFSATLGTYRDLCKNLAMFSTVQETHQAIRHTSHLRKNMDELIAHFQTLKESWQTLGEMIERMQNARVQMVDFMKEVYGEPEDAPRSITIHRNRTEAIFRRLHSERLRSGRRELGRDFEVSAWEAYNAVQGYTMWDATRKGSPTEFDRMLLANRDAKVLKAEKLAIAA